MKKLSIGMQIAACRNAAQPKKIPQKMIASILGVDISYVSKMESGSLVHSFTGIEVKRIADLFRQNNIPEEKVIDFINACDNTRISGGDNFESNVLNTIYKTLDKLPESRKKAYLQELEDRNIIWNEFQATVNDFKNNKSNFIDVDKNYQHLILQEEESRRILCGRLLLERSRILRYLGKIGDAEALFAQTIEISQTVGDKIFLAEVLEERGNFYRRSKQEELDAALIDYKQMLEIYSSISDEISSYRAQIKIASIILTSGLLIYDGYDVFDLCEKSIKFAEKKLAESSSPPMAKDVAKQYYYLLRKGYEYKAWAISMGGDYSEALKLQEKADEITNDHYRDDPKELAKGATYKAGFCLLSGKNQLAIELFKQALNFIDQMAPQKETNSQNRELFISALVELGLGTIKLQNGERFEAKRLLINSFYSADISNDWHTLGKVLQQLGKLEIIENNLISAKGKFELANLAFQKSGLEKKGNPYYLSLINLDLAEIGLLQSSNYIAYGHLRQIRTWSVDCYPEIMVYYNFMLAKLLIANHRNLRKYSNLAENYFISSINIAISLDTSIFSLLLNKISIECEMLYRKAQDKNEVNNVKVEEKRFLILLIRHLLNLTDKLLIHENNSETKKRIVNEWVKQLNFINMRIFARDDNK